MKKNRKFIIGVSLVIALFSCQAGGDKDAKSTNKTDFDWLAEKVITKDDLVNNGFKIEDGKYLRNAIYARHNYAFEDKAISDIFAEFSWYKAENKDVYARLSNKEKQNLMFLMTLDSLNNDTIIIGGDIIGRNGSYFYKGNYQNMEYIDSAIHQNDQVRIVGWTYDKDKLSFEEETKGVYSGRFDGALIDSLINGNRVKIYKGNYYNLENKIQPFEFGVLPNLPNARYLKLTDIMDLGW